MIEYYYSKRISDNIYLNIINNSKIAFSRGDKYSQDISFSSLSITINSFMIDF